LKNSTTAAGSNSKYQKSLGKKSRRTKAPSFIDQIIEAANE